MNPTDVTSATLRCRRCQTPIESRALARGDAGWVGAELLCGRCRPRRPTADAFSVADIPELAPLGCDRCSAAISIQSLYTEAIAYLNGRLYCAGCRANLGALLQAAGISAPPGGDEGTAWATCAGCLAGIAQRSIASGEARSLSGQLFCKSCSDALEAMGEETAQTLADLPSRLTYGCGECQDPVSLRAIVTGAAWNKDGLVLCPACLEKTGPAELGSQEVDPASAPPGFGPAAGLEVDLIGGEDGGSDGGREGSGGTRSDRPSSDSVPRLEPIGPATMPSAPPVGPVATVPADAGAAAAIETKPAEKPLPAGFTAAKPGRRKPRPSRIFHAAVEDTALLRSAVTDVVKDLPKAPPLECAACGSHVPIESLFSTPVAYHQGSLYCPRCRSDLATLLFSEGGGPSPPDVASAHAFCGACGDGISESQITRGHARGRDGHLLCPRCTGVVDAMAAETEATLSQLPNVISYPCGECRRSVSLKEIAMGEATHSGGAIFCAFCRGGRGQLVAESDEGALVRGAAAARPEARAPSPPSPGTKKRKKKQLPPAPGSPCSVCLDPIDKAMIEAEEFLRHGDMLACRDCRSKLEELTGPASAFTAQAAPAPIDLGLVGSESEPGFESEPEPEPEVAPRPRRITESQRISLDAPPCANCGAKILPAEIAMGNIERVAGSMFCHRCLDAARSLRAETESFARHVQSASVSCSKCDAVSPLEQAEELGWLFRDGDPFCPRCRGKVIEQRRRELTESGMLRIVKKEIVQEDAPIVASHDTFCSLCGEACPVTAEEQGNWLMLGGDHFCEQCRGEAERLLEISHQAVQTAIPDCAGCKAEIPFEDVRERRIAKAEGHVFCRTCATDLAAVLKRVRDEKKAALASCTGCGGKIPAEARRDGKVITFRGRLFCPDCGPEVAELRESTERIARRLGQQRTPCGGCGSPVLGRELEATIAVAYRGAIYCRNCRDQAYELIGAYRRGETISLEGVRTGRSCAACSTSVERKPGDRTVAFQSFVFCEGCAPEIKALRHETHIASRVPYANGLRCFECSERVGADALRAENAVSHRGRLYCPRCRVLSFDRFGQASDESANRCHTCSTEEMVAARKLRTWTFCRKCSGGLVESVVEETERLQNEARSASSDRRYTCYKCDSGIPRSDIQKGDVISRQGRLFCVKCSEPMALTVVYGARRQAEERPESIDIATAIKVAAAGRESDRIGIGIAGRAQYEKYDLDAGWSGRFGLSDKRGVVVALRYVGAGAVILLCIAGVVASPWLLSSGPSRRERPRVVVKRVGEPDPPPDAGEPDAGPGEADGPRRPDGSRPLAIPDVIGADGGGSDGGGGADGGSPNGTGDGTGDGTGGSGDGTGGGEARPAEVAGMTLAEVRRAAGAIVVSGRSEAQPGSIVTVLLVSEAINDRVSVALSSERSFEVRLGPYLTEPGPEARVIVKIADDRYPGQADAPVAAPAVVEKPPELAWPEIGAPGIRCRLRAQAWHYEKRPRRPGGPWRFLDVGVEGVLTIETPKAGANEPVRIAFAVTEGRVVREKLVRKENVDTVRDDGAERALAGAELAFEADVKSGQAWPRAGKNARVPPDVRAALARALASLVARSRQLRAPLPGRHDLAPDLVIQTMSTRGPTFDQVPQIIGVTRESDPEKERPARRLCKVEVVPSLLLRDPSSWTGPEGVPPIDVRQVRMAMEVEPMRNELAPPIRAHLRGQWHFLRPVEFDQDEVVVGEQEVWGWVDDFFERVGSFEVEDG